MTLELLHLNTHQALQYNEALDHLGGNHPYYKLEFLDIFYSGIEGSKALVMKSDSGKPVVVMPIYLRPIENDELSDHYDAISTWGYSGPQFHSNLEPENLEIFWRLVDDWYRENGIVSEFVRFKLDNSHLYYSGTLVEGMHNIKGKLKDPEIIWRNYNRKVRKNINKAKREGLSVKLFYADDISVDIFGQFYAIFEHTMDRTHAAASYYYSYEKLKAFMRNNPQNCALVLTFKDEKPVASEMILLSEDTVFSFIGGTLADYFEFRPNEILKDEIIKWAYRRGYEYFVLGGGYGKDDGIFRYKQAFFPKDICPFYTGRKIIDEKAYRYLSGLEDEPINIREDFFPLYRKPNASLTL